MSLFWHLWLREFRSRYLGSMSGLLWAFVHPVLQLALYATVFQHIFKARVVGAEAHGFVAFVGVGFWAWVLFAEASSRATTAVLDQAALIGKVKLSTQMLVTASVCATAAVHLLGYALALLILAASGTAMHWQGALLVPVVMAMLMLLTLGFAYFLSAVQVFIRDLAQIITQVLAFWFFLTPVVYSREMLPTFAQNWMAWNPLTYYPERLRQLLLEGQTALTVADAYALLIALAVFAIGSLAFRRLQRHFEDFL